ncbi:MAG: hypothetical protein M3020_03560 [Myxococcota bacterium]|nr:hypothetical protein [Myxococcota bacterium]
MLLGIVAACGKSVKQDSEPRSCAADSDCPDAQTCRLTAQTQEPVLFNPCAGASRCGDDAECPDGQVCSAARDYPGVPRRSCPYAVCHPPCSETGCTPGDVCGEGGLCESHECEQSGAEGCREHYRCDPAAAAARWHDSLTGSELSDAASPLGEALRGCVRATCDEPAGFACRDYWVCDPENAAGEASGCVPLSCRETGHCANDATSVCEPSNDGPRPILFDPHGCVGRNCAEGIECMRKVGDVNYSYCAVDAEGADSLGCKLRKCDEAPELCPPGYTCDAGGVGTTEFGCRGPTCNDPGGPMCPAGSMCSLVNGAYSCVVPNAGGTVSVPLGGSTSGSPNPSTSSGGRPSAAGGPAHPETLGVCVERE